MQLIDRSNENAIYVRPIPAFATSDLFVVMHIFHNPNVCLSPLFCIQQHFTEKHSRSRSNMKNIYVIAYNRIYIYIYSLSIRAVYASVDGYSCGNKIRMNNIEIIFFHVYMRMKKNTEYYRSRWL